MNHLTRATRSAFFQPIEGFFQQFIVALCHCVVSSSAAGLLEAVSNEAGTMTEVPQRPGDASAIGRTSSVRCELRKQATDTHTQATLFAVFLRMTSARSYRARRPHEQS
jgi:hypothetical protein